MRLTKKYATKEGTTIGIPRAVSCYWKLKEYEDIEEELGIDLITLFKALKNGIYYKRDKDILFENDIDLISLSKKALCCWYQDFCDYVYFNYFYGKDYGKTWALTKEELL